MDNYSQALRRIDTVISVFSDGFYKDTVLARFKEIDNALTGALDLKFISMRELQDLKIRLWDGYDSIMKNVYNEED